MTRRIWLIVDVLWLVGVGLYVFAGRDDVPFHGDESTHLYMSLDYHRLVIEGDLDAVLYRDPPRDGQARMDRDLRIVNGTVTKMTTGLAWDVAGLERDDINGPWAWWGTGDPREWDENIRQGHMPSERLLRIGRTVSTAFTALSVAVVFGIAWLVTERRIAAWAASFVYVSTPAVLLNGRRAMTEGALLLFSALVILLAVILVRAQVRDLQVRGARARTLAMWIALGGLGGFAVASKHSGAVTVLVACLGLALEPLLRSGVFAVHRESQPPVDADPPDSQEGTPRSAPTGNSSTGEGTEALYEFSLYARLGRWTALAGPNLLRVVGTGLLALAVFLLLNPAWWAEPLHMPGHVVDQRRALLDGQAEAFGPYDTLSERTAGLLNQAFFAKAQYFEVPVWEQFISVEINAYAGSWLSGRQGLFWGVLIVGAFAFGVGALVESFRGVSQSPPGDVAHSEPGANQSAVGEIMPLQALDHGRNSAVALTVLLWVGITALALLALTPMEWQRYYLPIQAPVAVVAGIGAARLVDLVRPLVTHLVLHR
ncbi:MAG: phospholipid carrier-dependent glycosyltransferase [Chloroflexi bacterium]|nr:phospholipid carrier-dependent glycosyltransferase [Chloroflexota bacterium]